MNLIHRFLPFWVSKTIPGTSGEHDIPLNKSPLSLYGYRKRYPAIKRVLTHNKAPRPSWVLKTIPDTSGEHDIPFNKSPLSLYGYRKRYPAIKRALTHNKAPRPSWVLKTIPIKQEEVSPHTTKFSALLGIENDTRHKWGA